MPRAILFGFEGGLVDPVAPRQEALTSVLADEGIALAGDGLEKQPPLAPYEAWLGRVIESERGRPDPDLAARLMVRAATRFRALSRERGPAWLDGALDFVERAGAAGVALGIVAALSRIEVERALEAAELAPRFKLVVGSEDLDDGSDRLDAYRLALARLNTEPPLPERLIHPHEVASIEGAAAGVRAAAAAGLIAVALGDAAGAPPEASLRVASLAGLAVSELDSG